MRAVVLAALLLLASGCASTRVVHLDTGRGDAIAFTPEESEPVEIGEDAFKRAVAQLVLDMRLDVAFREVEQDDRRSLLASSAGIVDGAQGRSVPPSYERICQRQDEPQSCLSLLAGGLVLGPTERRMFALYFALDTVWEGVEEAIRDMVNAAALRAMVTTMIGTALVMLVAPEPITKLIAIALTASLIAYLGTGPVWNIGQGFLRLMDESRDAVRVDELASAGHRFGRVLGDNGARVLVVVALAALGGKNAMAAQGPRMPGFAQAASRAQMEGGFQLAGALTGEVQAISVASAGVLNVTLAPTAVAAVAMGAGKGTGAVTGAVGGIQGDPDGEVHHICTDKNTKSDATGGPWTPEFERVFNRAGMKLDDPANLIRIREHKGPHPREYHEAVYSRIDRMTRGCRGTARCRALLVEELAKIARELVREGSELRALVTKRAQE
ncbi:AHH domain-containing protein [Myxococcus sp. K15C18031901]|uniref:AHH domain-containing protein n=1 Tax=Myxococcus dinghuensis TaxID=2906761 RepID=UPI0020A78D25|nr:AHH domain-containing protein [Myxococcus dinghuensis]MCP3103840.1 AHH domain-containing protein [Myxococcus dinghuensis]